MRSHKHPTSTAHGHTFAKCPLRIVLLPLHSELGFGPSFTSFCWSGFFVFLRVIAFGVAFVVVGVFFEVVWRLRREAAMAKSRSPSSE